jgi:lysophospholipase L1-like esterase
LGACGGGGGNSPAQIASATAPAPKAVLIDAEGDSTMCGYRIANGVGTCLYDVSPPTVLQYLLQQKFGTTVAVQNNGAPGTIINQDLNGSSIAPLATRLASSTARIVEENFGLNDAVNSTPAQFRVDLNAWIDTVQAMGKTPVLEEPNPTSFASPALDAIVAVIDDVAQQRGVALVRQYANIRTLPNWQAMLTDGVHPNDQLYAIKAQREAEVLMPIVSKLM